LPEFGKKQIIAILLIVIFGVSITGIYLLIDKKPSVIVAGGQISEDTTWSGHIFVENTVVVQAGVKLTILPGTFIEFKHYRDYKGPGAIGLFTNNGTIEAVGSPEAMIWFTSDAEEPINGDWGGISLQYSDYSVFKYVIIEFAIIGIEQYDSSVNISHSIIRWINTEGLYAERSNPTFEFNLLYNNGYHDIAMEQHNPDIVIRNNIFNGGHYSIHAEATNVTISQNYFVNYKSAISGGQYAHIEVSNNAFENMSVEVLYFDFTVVCTIYGNIVDGNGTVTVPALNIDDIGAGRLNYTPGDPEDQYLYVYDEEDETRRTLRRLTNVTAFGWSIAYAGGYVWRFNHRSKTMGTQQDFVRIHPDTQEKKFYGNNLFVNPRSLCHDGTYFWTYDFTLKILYKFSVNDTSVVIQDSIPVEGITGLTSDGAYLYSPSGGSKIIKYNMSGISLEEIDLEGFTGVGITWTGSHFWTDSGDYLSKWLPNGTLAGKIYPVALETTDLTWDGTHLWTIQKTCELWEDGKIFEMEILDDQFLLEI
jgi:hypothetical protein